MNVGDLIRQLQTLPPNLEVRLTVHPGEEADEDLWLRLKGKDTSFVIGPLSEEGCHDLEEESAAELRLKHEAEARRPRVVGSQV